MGCVIVGVLVLAPASTLDRHFGPVTCAAARLASWSCDLRRAWPSPSWHLDIDSCLPHQSYSSLIFVWPEIVARALTTRKNGYQASARVDTEGAGQRQYRVVHLLRGFALMSVSCCASVSMSCSGWCCTIFVCIGPFDIAEPSITRSTHRRDVGSTCCVVSGLWRGEFG